MTPLALVTWAERWGVPLQAMAELQRLALPVPPPPDGAAHTEAWAQSVIRLEAAALGFPLWRNNVGALTDDKGRLVRFGLANDNAQLNDVFKSSDLVGPRPILIGPHHVGTVIGQFVAREVKAPGWVYAGTPREKAQAAFITTVNTLGGDAAFATGPGTL